MPSLVERARQVIAVEEDDYFQGETIQYYINKGQRKVVSYMINQETELGRSLRALDNLKSIDTTTLKAGTDKGDYFTLDVNFPADLNQFRNLIYDTNTIMRELGQSELYKLQWSNVVPTSNEGYFYITNDGTNRQFRLYLHEDPDTNDLDVYYVKDPTDISLSDSTFAELPDQLENAVIYAAASMMVTQEMSEATQLFTQQFEQELQANVY